jgi:cytochrome P450
VSLKQLLSADARRDPYPVYARLHEMGQAAALGPDDRHAAVVYGYDAADRVLRDPTFRVLDGAYLDRSDTSWRRHPAIRLLQESLFNANGADHARLRRPFSQYFTARRVANLEAAIVRITDTLLDRLAESAVDGAPVDFMDRFALPLPSAVIGEMLGVPEADLAWFPSTVRAFDAVLEIGQRPMRQILAANTATLKLQEYFTDLVAARRIQPRDDLVSVLAQFQRDNPGQLTEPELLANLIVLFNAGFRTTANLLGNGMALLLEHPAALAALRDDPGLAPAYVEEILRLDPPVHFAVRFAAEDTETAGVPVAAGQSVVVLMGAANRDPRHFPDPDAFRPSRPDNHHLAFGVGPHYCLGALLGRAEGRLVLPRLLDRFPEPALAATPGDRYQLMLRGYDHLPVRLALANP